MMFFALLYLLIGVGIIAYKLRQIPLYKEYNAITRGDVVFLIIACLTLWPIVLCVWSYYSDWWHQPL